MVLNHLRGYYLLCCGVWQKFRLVGVNRHFHKIFSAPESVTVPPPFVSQVLSNVIAIFSLAPRDALWLPQSHASHLLTTSGYKVVGPCAVTLPGSQGGFPGRPVVTFPFVSLLHSLLIFIAMHFNDHTAYLWLMSLSLFFFFSPALLDTCLAFGFGLF